jgi:serine protease Do/serine protease DegQ
VVTALNGRPVRGAAELRARLGVMPVGETIDLQVRRGKETQSIKARIGELERGQVAGGQAIPDLAGAIFVNVQRGRTRAVLVNAVEAGSPAFQHGLRAGDVVFGVNQRRIATVQELAQLMRASERVALNVLRGDTQLALPIK